MADEPATGILDAAYQSLYKHDCASLTFQDIAAEANTSTASIQYHYHHDSRDQLFGVFLDGLCEFYSTIESVDEVEYLTRPEITQ